MIMMMMIMMTENLVTKITMINMVMKNICGALRDLVPSAQFKTQEKHPWRSVTFSKVAG